MVKRVGLHKQHTIFSIEWQLRQSLTCVMHLEISQFTFVSTSLLLKLMERHTNLTAVWKTLEMTYDPCIYSLRCLSYLIKVIIFHWCMPLLISFFNMSHFNKSSVKLNRNNYIHKIHKHLWGYEKGSVFKWRDISVYPLSA